MGTTSTSLLTFEEFERLPDHLGKRELLEGRVVEMPPADLLDNSISERVFLIVHAALSGAHARGEAHGGHEICRLADL